MLNTVILMGRLTADPELKSTPSGVHVTSFSIACQRSYASKGQERQTDFIDIVAWRQTAEFVSRYFRKGSMIAVEGSIQTRVYEDKNGNKRKAVEVVARGVHFAGSAGSKESGSSHQTGAPRQEAETGQEVSFSAEDFGDFEELSIEDLPY